MVSGLQLSEGKALGFMFSTGQVDSKATIQICFHWVKVDRTYKFIQLQGLILNNACKNVKSLAAKIKQKMLLQQRFSRFLECVKKSILIKIFDIF